MLGFVHENAVATGHEGRHGPAGCAVEITSFTPRSPRRASERRNSPRRSPWDLAAALVVDGHSHGHRDRDDASGLAHLHVGGVEPQIGPVALQRSIEEAALSRSRRTAWRPGWRRPTCPWPAPESGSTCLLDRSQRLLGHPPRLQEAREVAPLPQLRDLQLDRAGPGLPGPVAVAVAVGDTIRRALAVSGAGQPSTISRWP